MSVYLHRLIEIDGTFTTKNERRGHAKQIKRNSFSFITKVKEMVPYRG